MVLFAARGKNALLTWQYREKDLMTISNGSTLVGIFQSRYEAELALDELRQAGFDHKDIGFAIRGEDAVAGGAITDALLSKDGSAIKGMAVGGLAGGLFGAAAVWCFPGSGRSYRWDCWPAPLGFRAPALRQAELSVRWPGWVSRR